MYHMYADDFLLHTKLTTKSHINNSILSRCRNDVHQWLTQYTQVCILIIKLSNQVNLYNI